MDKKDLILTCNDFLKNLTPTRFIFGGSAALYIHGIDLGRDFHDIDVTFPDLDVRHRQDLETEEFTPIKIDKLPNPPIDLNYGEVEYCGEKMLAYDVESVIRIKRYMLDFVENKAKIKTPARLANAEKIRRDFKYLEDTYNIDCF